MINRLFCQLLSAVRAGVEGKAVGDGVGWLVGVGVAVVSRVGKAVGVGVVWGLTVIAAVVAVTRSKAWFVAVIVWDPGVLRVMLNTPMPFTNLLVMPEDGKTAWLSVDVKTIDAP